MNQFNVGDRCIHSAGYRCKVIDLLEDNRGLVMVKSIDSGHKHKVLPNNLIPLNKRVYNKSAIDTQVGGDHYLMPIQVFDFIAANKDHLDGYKAAILKDVMKYIVRHESKGGKEDLEKAIHLIQMYKEKEYVS